MHRPAPGTNHEKSEQLNVNIIGDCDPGDDETEVHSNAKPRLRPVCDTLHERVDDETARVKSRESLNKKDVIDKRTEGEAEQQLPKTRRPCRACTKECQRYIGGLNKRRRQRRTRAH
jgi:hypothetical protein